MTKVRHVTTEDDYQDSIPIRVFQGERPNVRDNVLLGEFDLEGLPPVKRGIPEVEVTFAIDSNGILHVSAVDKATKSSGAVTITADRNRLSEADIKRMIKDVEVNAEKDRLWQAAVDARHELEHYIYSLRNVVEGDSKGKKAGKGKGDDKDGDASSRVTEALSKGDILRVKKAIHDATQFVEADRGDAAGGRSAEEYKAKQEEVEAICGPIMAKLYGGKGGDRGRGDDYEDDSRGYHDEL